MSERPQGASGDAAGDETRPIIPPDQTRSDYASEHAPASAGEHQPAYAAPMPPATAAQETAAPTAPRQRLRDRLWGLRALIAVALASVIVGGLAGAALANVSNHDAGSNRAGGPGFGRHGGFAPGQRHRFGNGNGFQPPGQQGRPGQQGNQAPSAPSS